jgi:hypothetical protein
VSEPLLSARRFAVPNGDPFEFFYEQGWTDGLPVVPPTEEKVLRFVEASGRAPGDVVGAYPSRSRIITVEQVAINAVMAGCRPEYFPVVLAIVGAMTAEPFGIHPANASTGGSAVGFIVNGPVRTRLGMNCRGNVLGPGNRANSTIGRALRLTQLNAFGSLPGAGNEQRGGRPILDRATIGQPGKYAGYHIVENEEDFPGLRPLHTELGFSADEDVVTVFPTSGHLQISAHVESSATEIADTVSQYLVGTGRLASFGFCVLIIPPENAEIFVRDGWSKADIRRAIFEGTTRSVAWVRRQGWSTTGGLGDRRGGEPAPGDEERSLAIAGREEDVLVVVAGGPAGAFIHALLPFAGTHVSRLIEAA